MRAGILTFHRADNYGAILQAKALCEVMRQRDCTAEIIDYRCKAIENVYQFRYFPKLRKNIFAWSMRLAYNCRRVPRLKACSKKCNAFRDKYLNLSPSYTAEKDRIQVQNDYDIILTGSDQVWNPMLTDGLDKWYAFQGSDGHSYILASYGASIGNMAHFSKKLDEYKDTLQNYDYLSVRETEAQVYLNKELGRNVYKVLDPTLLLSADYWAKMQDGWKPKIQKEYVLYYDANCNIRAAREIAQDVAKNEHLCLVHFNAGIVGIRNSLYAQDAGPIEFLSLIKNAKYIVTSSFHATVFSVLFQKQFVVVPHPQTGVRVRNLMHDLELDERICEAYRDFKLSLIDKEINYKRAFSLLDDLKKESLDYIDMVLESARERTGMNEN